MNDQFLSGIISDVYAIHPKIAASFIPSIVKAIKGDKLDFGDAKELREQAVERSKVQFANLKGGISAGTGSYHEISSQRTFRDLTNDSIAIITLNGIVRKESGYCHKGTNETLHEIRMAGEHPKVKGIIFRTHSGGGSVFGTQSVGNALYGFRSSYDKPCYGLVDSQADSAAYWMVSQCEKVFIVNNTCEAGCIGTMSTFFDYSAMMEAEGIREVIVRASQSFNKNEEYYQAFQGNLEPLRLNILDPLNAEFHKDVIRGRKNSKGFNLKDRVSDGNGNQVARILSGITLYGKDIVKQGLADGVATLQEVVTMIEKESRKIARTKNTNSSISMENQDFEAIDKLNLQGLKDYAANSENPKEGINYANALAGKLEADANVSNLNAEIETLKADKIKDASTIQGLNTEIEGLKASDVSAKDEIKALKASNETLKDEKSNLETSVTELKDEKQKADNKASAYETFINSQYGEEAATKFVPGADGKIIQPEGLQLQEEETTSSKKKMNAKSIVDNLLSD